MDVVYRVSLCFTNELRPTKLANFLSTETISSFQMIGSIENYDYNSAPYAFSLRE